MLDYFLNTQCILYLKREYPYTVSNIFMVVLKLLKFLYRR